MSHNATPNTSRVELRKTLTLIPVVMMGLAYMQPMTLFDTFGIYRMYRTASLVAYRQGPS